MTTRQPFVWRGVWRRCGGLPLMLGAGCIAGCGGGAAVKGTSSLEVLGAPPPAWRSPAGARDVEKSDERIDYVSGYAKAPLAKPAYPAAALAAGAGGQVVYATVTVDEFGHVTEVVPSWERIALRGRFADAFFAAVKTAVATWQMEPAHAVYYQRVPGGRDRYLRTEAVPMVFEVRFEFAATGEVR